MTLLELRDTINAATNEISLLPIELREERYFELMKRLPDDARSLWAAHCTAHIVMNAHAKTSTTVLVAGDYIEGSKYMNNNSINIGGDVINSQVGQALSNCTNMIQQQAPGEIKTVLEALKNEVKTLIDHLPPEKKEEAASDLELAVKATTSAPPNRKWYSVSAKGLLEASKFAKDFAGNIIGTLKNLGELRWPGFSLQD